MGRYLLAVAVQTLRSGVVATRHYESHSVVGSSVPVPYWNSICIPATNPSKGIQCELLVKSKSIRIPCNPNPRLGANRGVLKYH